MARGPAQGQGHHERLVDRNRVVLLNNDKQSLKQERVFRKHHQLQQSATDPVLQESQVQMPES